jgi:hypothetical protein
MSSNTPGNCYLFSKKNDCLMQEDQWKLHRNLTDIQAILLALDKQSQNLGKGVGG